MSDDTATDPRTDLFAVPLDLRDGEPVTDLAFALPLPTDFVPWELVVEAYLVSFEPQPQRAAA